MGSSRAAVSRREPGPAPRYDEPPTRGGRTVPGRRENAACSGRNTPAPRAARGRLRLKTYGRYSGPPMAPKDDPVFRPSSSGMRAAARGARKDGGRERSPSVDPASDRQLISMVVSTGNEGPDGRQLTSFTPSMEAATHFRPPLRHPRRRRPGRRPLPGELQAG